MDHAFKGTRFPWTKERMEFILNELITKHKKFKQFQKLIDIYILLAEKIGATPRIVENFVKNLARDYRELMRVDIDRETAKLRGSNKIFKMFEEYERLYIQQDLQVQEGGFFECSDTVSDGEEQDDTCQVIECVELGMKHEPVDLRDDSKNMSVVNVDEICAAPDSPLPPPPPPVPKQPKTPQGRRVTGKFCSKSKTSATGQSPVMADMASHAQRSSPEIKITHIQGTCSPATGQGMSAPLHVLSAAAPMISQLSQMPLTSFQQHTTIPTMSTPTVPQSQYIPVPMLHEGVAQRMTGGKRQTTDNHTAAQPTSKRTRKSTFPLVSQDLPSEMTEFERRFLQSLDTQNQMLSDISHELKLLRTGFYAIHSDDIAPLVTQNVL